MQLLQTVEEIANENSRRGLLQGDLLYLNFSINKKRKNRKLIHSFTAFGRKNDFLVVWKEVDCAIHVSCQISLFWNKFSRQSIFPNVQCPEGGREAGQEKLKQVNLFDFNETEGMFTEWDWIDTEQTHLCWGTVWKIIRTPNMDKFACAQLLLNAKTQVIQP